MEIISMWGGVTKGLILKNRPHLSDEPTTVVYGPQGCGKAHHLKRIAEGLGLFVVLDE